MKIRLTIMTENDKHIDSDISKEKMERTVSSAWEYILHQMADDGEKAIVEKCEVIEM